MKADQGCASQPYPGTSRRGRPPARTAPQRDAHLLDVAERLFLEHGFRQVSLARIARSAGAATRTIYTRFGGKRGLLESIIARRGGDDGLAAAPLEAASDPKGALERLATHAFEHALSVQGNLLRADALAAREWNAGSVLHQLYSSQWYEILETVLQGEQWQLGAAPLDNTSILADLFIGCLIREFVADPPHDGVRNRAAETSHQLASQALRRFFSVARAASS